MVSSEFYPKIKFIFLISFRKKSNTSLIWRKNNKKINLFFFFFYTKIIITKGDIFQPRTDKITEDLCILVSVLTSVKQGIET